MFCVVCRFVVYRVADGRRKGEDGTRKKKRRKEEGVGKVRTAQMGWRWRWWRWWLAVAKAMPLVAVTWLPGPYLCHRTSNATPNPAPPRTSFHVLYFLQARRGGFLLYHLLILLSRLHIFRDHSSYLRPGHLFTMYITLITFFKLSHLCVTCKYTIKWPDTVILNINFFNLLTINVNLWVCFLNITSQFIEVTNYLLNTPISFFFCNDSFFYVKNASSYWTANQRF